MESNFEVLIYHPLNCLFLHGLQNLLNMNYRWFAALCYSECDKISSPLKIKQVTQFTIKSPTISINLFVDQITFPAIYVTSRCTIHILKDLASNVKLHVCKLRCLFYKSRRERTAFDQFYFRGGLNTCGKMIERRVNLSETVAAESIEDLGLLADLSISPSRNIRSSHVAITSPSSRSCEEELAQSPNC